MKGIKEGRKGGMIDGRKEARSVRRKDGGKGNEGRKEERKGGKIDGRKKA
jgi:hypothetical protein